jgi:ADP-ribosylglycohydrolase
MAYNDAKLSHVKNGIYGEMFIAAILANAFICTEPKELIEKSLNYIPRRSRLCEAIRYVLELHEKEPNWENAWEKVMEKYGNYHTVHTINNACFVALGLLYGEGDFGKSICIAVESGLDTDCNGATVGSIMGIIFGANKLPKKWIEPLNDTLESLVPGFQKVKISDLARRIIKLCL